MDNIDHVIDQVRVIFENINKFCLPVSFIGNMSAETPLHNLLKKLLDLETVLFQN